MVSNGEDQFKQFLDCMDEGLFEVKKDFYRNGRMVVEVEQKPRGRTMEAIRLDGDQCKVLGLHILR